MKVTEYGFYKTEDGDTIYIYAKIPEHIQVSGSNNKYPFVGSWYEDDEIDVGFSEFYSSKGVCAKRSDTRYNITEYIGKTLPTTHTITIDGVDIELSDDSFNELKKQLT